MAVCRRWLYDRMLSFSYISWESWVMCLLLLCSRMMSATNRVHYHPIAVFVCLYITLPHYHHYSDLSKDIELLKCLSIHSASNVCLRLSQFSQLCFIQYMELCIFSLPIYLMMIVGILELYLIISIKSEV